MTRVSNPLINDNEISYLPVGGLIITGLLTGFEEHLGGTQDLLANGLRPGHSVSLAAPPEPSTPPLAHHTVRV